MMNTFNSFWIFLLIFGVIGAEADEVKTESVVEGDSVTLNPHLTQTQGFIQIQWRFGDKGSVIAQNDGTETSYPHLTDIFGGRLQLDHQTGSLTIKNMKIKHSGLYKLQIDFTTGPSRMTFSVAVYVSPSVIDVVCAEMKSVSVMEGGSVTLQTDVTETHGDELIVWRFGDEGKLIAKSDIEANNSTLYETDERFRDRLKLDHQTGSLNITHTTTEDSELYTVKISSSSKQTIYKRFILTVSVPDKPDPDPGLSSGAVAGIVVVLLLVFAVAAAAGVIFYRRKISELIGEKSVSVSVKKGGSVTLHTDVPEIQRDDQIEWRFGNEGTPIAQIKRGFRKIYEDVLNGRFRGRLKLDEKTGSLTITNMKNRNSELYELKISQDGEIKYKKFRVSVYVSVKEGKSVTLPTDAPEVKTDDQIEWRFGNGGPLIAQIKRGIIKIYDDVLDGRFRGRLKLDEETGDLTITNTEIKHDGVYELKIKSSSGVSDKKLSVIIRGRQIPVEEGEPLTLNPETEIQRDDQILWRFRGNLIAQIKKGTGETFDDVPGGRFRDRLTLDEETGSLTITDMRDGESGHYKLQIINSRGTTDKRFFVNVWRREISVTEGKPLTLNPETEIQRDDQILWRFEENLIAQIKEGTGETFDDVLGGRFRGRLKLDEETGSLTITNMRYEESGHYKLQIINSRGNTDRRFFVKVWLTNEERKIRVEEGEPLTLNPETEIQTDDLILWRFRDNLIAQIKEGTGETFDDVLDGRFRGRLKLDEKTGDLTITDMSDDESGHYKLQIISSRGSTDRRFSVTVWEPDMYDSASDMNLKLQSNEEICDGEYANATLLLSGVGEP